MIRLRLLPLALAAGVVTASPAAAQHVVYWADDYVGTSSIPGAMSLLQGMMPGLTVTAATDQDHFNTLVSSGSVTLAVFGEQSSNVFAGSSSVLATFVANGGTVLGATWRGDGMSAFFGADPITSNGESVTGSGALFAGLTSPIALTGGSWGVFAQGYATSEECLATMSNGGCAAVLGNGGRTLLLGPLFDTYVDPDVGAQFLANGAGVLLGAAPTVTPEPATVALLGTGLLGMGAFGLRRRRVEA